MLSLQGELALVELGAELSNMAELHVMKHDEAMASLDKECWDIVVEEEHSRFEASEVFERHIEVAQHWICKLKEQGPIKVVWQSGATNGPDIFTKNLGGPAYAKDSKKCISWLLCALVHLSHENEKQWHTCWNSICNWIPRGECWRLDNQFLGFDPGLNCPLHDWKPCAPEVHESSSLRHSERVFGDWFAFRNQFGKLKIFK